MIISKLSVSLHYFTFSNSFTNVFIRLYSSSNSVRVRFAPSPTGNLHLGGLRTAFYNYLFARKHNGQFILRIEDTDQTRLKVGSLENIHSMLQWTGIIPDESPFVGGPYGPYTQSQKREIYQKKANELIEKGAAYRCFCSETRLDIIRKEALRNRQNPAYDNKCRYLTDVEIQEYLNKNQPYTIRFKLHEGPISFNDLVFGLRSLDISEQEGDFIILKSDGLPTYHFACVVDDHDMKISHVLRGAEWLVSTPKHIMLHKTFGWEPPVFAHLGLLINSDRTKLSKRQEALSIEYFKKQQYEPLAILNFLTSIGAGFGPVRTCDVEDIDQLCQKFSISEINTNSCVLDLSKLDVFNQNFLRKQISDESTLNLVAEKAQIMLQEEFGERLNKNGGLFSNDFIRKILRSYKDRLTTLNDLIHSDMHYLWIHPDFDEIVNNLDVLHINQMDAVNWSHRILEFLATVPETDFVKDKLVKLIRRFSNENLIPYNSLMKTLRILLTGQVKGPGVAEILQLLGPKYGLQKLNSSIEFVEEKIHLSHEKNQCTKIT